jgi:hypothetical protein
MFDGKSPVCREGEYRIVHPYLEPKGHGTIAQVGHTFDSDLASGFAPVPFSMSARA